MIIIHTLIGSWDSKVGALLPCWNLRLCVKLALIKGGKVPTFELQELIEVWFGWNLGCLCVNCKVPCTNHVSHLNSQDFSEASLSSWKYVSSFFFRFHSHRWKNTIHYCCPCFIHGYKKCDCYLHDIPYVLGTTDGSHVPIVALFSDPNSHYCKFFLQHCSNGW